MRMRPSGIPLDHPIVQAGIRMGKTWYGSPTTSDQALIPATSIKIGPGDSARSHTADEYIGVDEIREGIDTYINLLEEML
jgi:acetylornithine deacetylase